MMLSALAGAVTWMVAALIPLSLQALIITMSVVNVAAVLGNSVTGGLLVDKGREHRSTGRLSAMRVLAMNTTSLLAGPLGGWLASRAFPATCAVAGASMLVMVVLGGAGTRYGAMIGGFLYTLLDQRLGSLAGSSTIQDLPDVLRVPLSEPLFVLGTLFVLLVFFLPGGLAGIGRRGRRRGLRTLESAVRPEGAREVEVGA